MFVFTMTVMTVCVVGLVLIGLASFVEDRTEYAMLALVLALFGITALLVNLVPESKERGVSYHYLRLTDKEYLQIMNQRAAENETENAQPRR